MDAMRSVRTAAHAPPAAEARDLSFSYADRRALDGISLSVPAGSIFGLLGPNGSGKSTLLSLLAGLRAPDSGSALLLGEPPSPALRSRIGFLFQETSLDPLMTVRETLWLHGRLYGMTQVLLRERIEALLGAVGLIDRANALVRTLSGGMKRRLELARALVPSPALLLLDEPTTGLDPDSEQALWSHLLQINGEGVTIILATNRVTEAERYCRTVAFIHEGRLIAEGAPAELKAGLKHDAVWLEGDFTPALIEKIEAWPDVAHLNWRPPVLHATVDAASAFVPRLFETAEGRISSVRVREATLEDAYFDIVGASISNGGAA